MLWEVSCTTLRPHKFNPAVQTGHRHRFLRLLVSSVIFKILQVFEEHFQDAERIFTGSFSLLQGTWLSCTLLTAETEMSTVRRLKSTEVHKEPSDPPLTGWFGLRLEISLAKHPSVRTMILQQPVTFVCLNHRPSHRTAPCAQTYHTAP